MEQEQDLPVLGGIALALRWLEELIVLVSGPMLTAGLGIGLVALLSDGALLVSAPWLLYDELVTADLRALALAACWLEDASQKNGRLE